VINVREAADIPFDFAQRNNAPKEQESTVQFAGIFALGPGFAVFVIGMLPKDRTWVSNLTEQLLGILGVLIITTANIDSNLLRPA
jgi:hypothetical protein